MHNRRTVSSTKSNQVLPLHQSDIHAGDSSLISPKNVDNNSTNTRHSNSKRRSNKNTFRMLSKTQLQNVYKCVIVLVTIIIFFVFVLREIPNEEEDAKEIQKEHVSQTHPNVQKEESKNNNQQTNHDRSLYYSYHDNVPTKEDFPSLEYPFVHSEVVGLYFAASWCPQSTPVTNLIDEQFRDITIQPPHDFRDKDTNSSIEVGVGDEQIKTEPPVRNGFSIVYVSSDLNEHTMIEYSKPNWFVVPYSNYVNERQHLKKFYKTCARREMTELNILHREREIPSLIILSGETRHVLTYNGIQDIQDYSVQAVDHWLELNRLNLALLDKFS